MARLAVDERRVHPPVAELGRARRRGPGDTRETMVVVEAAGFDVVFVETVGVGQSETTVANMVDTFLLLTLARTGDSLQGIKKGVLELADVHRRQQGRRRRTAREARGRRRELAGALHLMAPRTTAGARRC